MSQSFGLPPIDQSLLPASVRSGGPKATQLYDESLAFESLLDQQVAQSLTDTLQPTDGSSPDATTSMLSQLLPQALSQGLVADGGVGLASQIYQSLAGNQTTGSNG